MFQAVIHQLWDKKVTMNSVRPATAAMALDTSTGVMWQSFASVESMPSQGMRLLLTVLQGTRLKEL